MLTSTDSRTPNSNSDNPEKISPYIAVDNTNQNGTIDDDMGRGPAFGQSVWLQSDARNRRGNACTRSSRDCQPTALLLPATCQAPVRQRNCHGHGDSFGVLLFVIGALQQLLNRGHGHDDFLVVVIGHV